MKKLAFTVGIALLGALCVVLVLRTGASEKTALEQTRRELHQRGFKVDLTEFDFSQSPEMSWRVTGLTDGPPGPYRPGMPIRQIQRGLRDDFDLMKPIKPGVAVAIWKEDKLFKRYTHENIWQRSRDMFAENKEILDQAANTVLSGPFAFDLVATNGLYMLLPHVARLRNLCDAFAERAVLALHDHEPGAAWTNFMVATRLLTAWRCEPVEVSMEVRCLCAKTAFEAAWEILQTNVWSDQQLVTLQQEWESVDFFKDWPETIAFRRVSTAAAFQLERRQPLPVIKLTAQEVLRSPRTAWANLNYKWNRQTYRSHGSYDDEKSALLYYRDRELEVRQALTCATWSAMSAIPGITNSPPFQPKLSGSMVQVMLRGRDMIRAAFHTDRGSLGVSAEAEVRRRLVITAIALRRYRNRHGAYPQSLAALTPEFLGSPPVDFMDGKPLRYRPVDSENFILYSVGLDCIDNGGEMTAPETPGLFRPAEFRESPDIVWPQTASDAAVGLLRKKELEADTALKDREDERITQLEWDRAARRQAKVEAAFPVLDATTPEPVYQGRPLSELLRNNADSDTNKLTLAQMLTLRQVVTGAEPETVTFEFPVNYDFLTNRQGELHLYVDPVADDDSDSGSNAGELECQRATNGDCLLVWHTIFEAPGKHALQAGLMILPQPGQIPIFAEGPGVPFVVSNLCQFSLSSATFDPAIGATLRATLPEANGTYQVDLKLPDGHLLKTLNGSTSNGIITVFWDLVDDRGRRMTNESFDSFFSITLPDSGRSQHLKGP